MEKTDRPEALIKLEFDIDCIDTVMKQSYGQPTVSPEENKEILIYIRYALSNIQQTLDEMNRFEEPKKTFLQKLLRK